jgi:hypothetical protein
VIKFIQLLSNDSMKFAIDTVDAKSTSWISLWNTAKNDGIVWWDLAHQPVQDFASEPTDRAPWDLVVGRPPSR